MEPVGKISTEKAAEICKKYYDIPYASAFQIRFAGFKGVVAIDPTLSGKALQFRPSMKKFESVYNRLDILNIATYIPCYLNRQVIIILSSLGVSDEAFNALHDQALMQLGNMLIENQVASDFIAKYYHNVFTTSVKCTQLNYTFEPFFRGLIKTIRAKMLKDLIGKSRIFVEKGRILMGTIDETRTLKENEVFIQCRYGPFDKLKSYEGILTNETDYDSFIVNSKVTIAKNPCMHPGDVRVLQAVDQPSLHHMVDCIVFPSVGPRPIPNMCSGSDLDGDLYFVTWEPSLIPNKVEEPMVYDSEPPKTQSEPIKIEQIIQFFVNFIEVDQLGRIANAHVALSDSSCLGVKDPVCVSLAKIFSLAVDFPKTGYMAKVPSDLKSLKYPDFMEKKGTSYESQKIIGKMYRKCKQLVTDMHFSDEFCLNSSFVVAGHEKYLKEAIESYLKYR